MDVTLLNTSVKGCMGVFWASQLCRLNICRYIGWIEKYCICQFNQYNYKYWDGSVIYFGFHGMVWCCRDLGLILQDGKDRNRREGRGTAPQQWAWYSGGFLLDLTLLQASCKRLWNILFLLRSGNLLVKHFIFTEIQCIFFCTGLVFVLFLLLYEVVWGISRNQIWSGYLSRDVWIVVCLFFFSTV